MPEDSGQDSAEERVNRILDELLLAKRWQRPSLIMAVYRSEHIKEKVQNQINLSLKSHGLSVLPYFVHRSHYDIPRELLEYPHHEEFIFTIHRVRWGGGRGYSNAFRALNMHREYLVQGSIKAIFWLTMSESRQVARFAPDFWSFRHLVVEFPDLPTEATGIASTSKKKAPLPVITNHSTDLRTLCENAENMAALGCMEEALQIYKQAVRKYPEENLLFVRRAEVLLSIGQIPAAKNALKRARKFGTLTGARLKEYDRLKKVIRNTPPGPRGISERVT